MIIDEMDKLRAWVSAGSRRSAEVKIEHHPLNGELDIRCFVYDGVFANGQYVDSVDSIDIRRKTIGELEQQISRLRELAERE